MVGGSWQRRWDDHRRWAVRINRTFHHGGRLRVRLRERPREACPKKHHATGSREERKKKNRGGNKNNIKAGGGRHLEAPTGTLRAWPLRQ